MSAPEDARTRAPRIPPVQQRNFTGARCAHCGGPQIGAAAVLNRERGRLQLCHPAYGMDCYRLVTVYGHGMPCQCRGDTSDPDHDRCYLCGYRRFEHSVDPCLSQEFDFLGNPIPCREFLESPPPDPFVDLP